jgi:hypothetical protein
MDSAAAPALRWSKSTKFRDELVLKKLMSFSRQSALSLLGAAIFAVAAVVVVKTRRLVSSHGGLVTRENSPFMFVICVGRYFVIAIVLIVGAFVL